jgi:hypothetical protein
MEANKKRQIKNGAAYQHFFPTSEGATITIRKNANVYHTVDFIPKVVQSTLAHTEQIAAYLNANDVYTTCKSIWHFVYEHINYKKDTEGYEQIRSPARAWHDREQGVDCDCYSVFISSILTNLGIPHTLRITKYHKDYFQHIYPIVPTNTGYITIDCVTDQFNYEVPFSEKKDYPMDLQYLNGLDNIPALYADPNEAYLMGTDAMGDLGKIIAKRFAKGAARKPPMKTANPTKSRLPMKRTNKQPMNNQAAPAQNPNAVPKKKKGKLLNKINKINPATVALRNGILASMKLNIKNVAKRLRWSYLTKDEAIRRDIDANKFDQLVATRQRLENIFYKAGGKLPNLRAAILKGKGNNDKAVNGLDGLNEYMPLSQLLGQEIFYTENVEGMGSLGELGEPITLATIAAASGVLAGIVGMLQQIGDIFKKKQKASEDFNEQKTEAAENNVSIPPTATNPIVPTNTPTIRSNENEEPSNNNQLPALPNNNMPMVSSENKMASNNELAPMEKMAVPSAIATDAATGASAETPSNESFWDKNKKWAKPVLIGVGGLSIIAIGIKMFKGNKTTAAKPSGKTLSGVPKRRAKNHYRKSTTKYGKKKAIALL